MSEPSIDRPHKADNPFVSAAPHPLNYPSPAGTLPQLSDDHLLALADARKRFAPIRRQISFATFDAWSVAIFAGLTLAFGFTNWPALLVGIGMAGVALVEFRAIQQLRNVDPRAPRRLAINQLAFGGILILYAVCHLLVPGPALSTDVQELAAASPELAASLASVSSMIRRATYFGVIAFAVIFQGGAAMYHFSRTPLLRRYAETLTPWLRQLHSAGLMR